MSGHRIKGAVVRCDGLGQFGHGCDAESVDHFEWDDATVSKLRRDLKVVGWTRVGEKDYCKKCSVDTAKPHAEHAINGVKEDQ